MQARTDEQGGDAANAVGHIARGHAADNAEAEHQRQHFRAACHAIAEIRAIGDNMHLRHGHGDTAGDSGNANEPLQHIGLEAENEAIGLGSCRQGRINLNRGRAAQDERERQGDGERCKAYGDIGLPPADGGQTPGDKRRPDRPGDIIAEAQMATAMPRFSRNQ